MWWILAATLLAIPLLVTAYLQAFQAWYKHKTFGDRYFSQPLAKRLQFRKTLQKHAIVLLPIMRFMATGIAERRIATFAFRNIKGPSAIADAQTFAQAVNYPASPDDIFVATFMKSGTTWMQNIVFELLHHGEGDFSDHGYRHMYAASPWLECSPNASVAIKNAPLISRYKKRLVKTHMPADLCPFNSAAKYIYVVRHPASTFSSCENFFRMLMGPFCPDRDALLQLFCSNDMLWGTWPQHVSGWWQLAQQHSNVLFIGYEEMQQPPLATLKTIANFLGLSLTAEELQKVAEKTAFAAMKAQEYYFEMSPPNIFSVSSDRQFLDKGAIAGNDQADSAETKVIMDFCAEKMPMNGFPLARFYAQD